MKGAVPEPRPNQFKRVCDDVGLAKYREAISKLPRFPFAYYFLALCLRDRNDSNWRTEAKAALAIFERTVKIAGHDGAHEQARDYLKSILGQDTAGK